MSGRRAGPPFRHTRLKNRRAPLFAETRASGQRFGVRFVGLPSFRTLVARAPRRMRLWNNNMRRMRLGAPGFLAWSFHEALARHAGAAVQVRPWAQGATYEWSPLPAVHPPSFAATPYRAGVMGGVSHGAKGRGQDCCRSCALALANRLRGEMDQVVRAVTASPPSLALLRTFGPSGATLPAMGKGGGVWCVCCRSADGLPPRIEQLIIVNGPLNGAG